MVDCSEKDGRLYFAVVVVPRAARSEIVGEYHGAVRVRLAAPPVDGKANENLRRMLAGFFSVPQRAVEILSGATSKRKRVCVTGVHRATFEAKLQALKIA